MKNYIGHCEHAAFAGRSVKITCDPKESPSPSPSPTTVSELHFTQTVTTVTNSEIYHPEPTAETTTLMLYPHVHSNSEYDNHWCHDGFGGVQKVNRRMMC